MKKTILIITKCKEISILQLHIGHCLETVTVGFLWPAPCDAEERVRSEYSRSSLVIGWTTFTSRIGEHYTLTNTCSSFSMNQSNSYFHRKVANIIYQDVVGLNCTSISKVSRVKESRHMVRLWNRMGSSPLCRRASVGQSSNVLNGGDEQNYGTAVWCSSILAELQFDNKR